VNGKGRPPGFEAPALTGALTALLLKGERNVKKHEIKRIMHVRRLGTSLYGNPYFELIFDDFTSARTQINASINYEIENKDLWETDVAIFTTKAGRVWNIVPVDKLPDDTKYRWIAYFHNPLGGFDVERYESIEAAKAGLVSYCQDTGFYHDLQTSGQYGCSGALHPYSKEDWAEAKEYEEIGCPFDCPSKVMSRGPMGGVKVENA